MIKNTFRKTILHAGNSILLYLPAILFWRFVLWYGDPDGERYVTAFRIFSIAALLHVLALTYWRKTVDRFALSTDIWLIVCGLLSWLAMWDALRFFGDYLRVTGYWIVVFLTGVAATYGFKGGFIGADTASADTVRRYNLQVLLLTGAVLIGSFWFRNQTFLAAVLPTIALSLVSEKFCRDGTNQNVVR